MDDGIDELAGGGEETVAASTADGGTADPQRRADAEHAAVAELERLLVARGPLTVEELAERLAGDSPRVAADLLADRPATELVDRLVALTRQADAFWRIPDGRLAPVLHHLRRATFTHRLTAREQEREVVDLCPDLVALALPRSFSLRDGTELRTAGASDDVRAAEAGSILGPAGWLTQFAPGDLFAVRYDGEQAQFERIPDDALDVDAARAVGESLRLTFAELPGDRAPEVHRLVVDTMGGHPASFAVPVAPVAELLAAVGLAVREAWVGPADRPWPTPPEAARRRRLEELLAAGEGCCRRSARRALESWHEWLRAGTGDHAATIERGEAARLAEDIDHGPVAVLLAELATLGPPMLSVRRLGTWAGAIAAATDKPAAGVEYLRAVGADAAGDALAAEAHLHAGLRVAPQHPACLGYLSELAEDRGDAQQSLALLRRAGRPPGPEAISELQPFLVDPTVGRNEPCPCGSGRKFKQCCARRPVQRPLLERCRWLLSKATRHAVRTDPLAVQSLRHLFGASSGGADAVALVGDMLLFPNRGLARYLDARGDLLPPDELACARSWVGQPMRLLEVEATDPGGSVDVVDLRGGERLVLVDAAAAATVGRGEAVLARPLPVGDRWLLTTALVRVPPASRDRALEMLEQEVRPFQLLQLLVDVQVDALRG